MKKELPSLNVTSESYTSLRYNIEQLNESDVFVHLDKDTLSFDLRLRADIEESDFLKFLDRYKYDALEADALLTAVTKLHNKIMLSRILYRASTISDSSPLNE